VLASFAYTYHPDFDGAASRRIETITREDGAVWTYGYNDEFFHLTDADYSNPANPASADLSWHYEYDGIGNRIGQEMPGIPGSRVEFQNSAENFQLSRDHLGRILLVGTYSGTTNNLRLRVNGTPVTLQGTSSTSCSTSAPTAYPTNVRVTAAWEEINPAASQPAECASVVTGAVYLPAVLPQLQYTANGDLAHDGVNHYHWDAYGNLAAVVQTNQPAWYMEKYTYDAFRRRSSRTTFHDPAKSGNWIADQTHTYFYDDWNPVREDIANAFGPVRTLEYVWGPDLVGQAAGGHASQGAGGVGGLLAVIDRPAGGGSPRTLLPLTDHLGTTHLLLDQATGATTRFRYAPFGEPLARDGSTGGGADPDGVFGHLYSTKPYNEKTGLSYYGYRYYHPRSGRWISRDPIAEDGGLNLFGFIENDPINRFDFLGLAMDELDQWHHLFPQGVFKDEVLKEYGTSLKKLGMDGDYIHESKWGWIMHRDHHVGSRPAGITGIHPEWNNEWKAWFDKQKDEGRKITRGKILDKLRAMRGIKSRFRPLLDKGEQAKVPHSLHSTKPGINKLKAAANEFAEKTGVDISSIRSWDDLKDHRAAHKKAAEKTAKKIVEIAGVAGKGTARVGAKALPIASAIIAYNSPRAQAMEPASRRVYAMSATVGGDMVYDGMEAVDKQLWAAADVLAKGILDPEKVKTIEGLSSGDYVAGTMTDREREAINILLKSIEYGYGDFTPTIGSAREILRLGQ